MKKKFEAPKFEKVEFTVAARLEGSGVNLPVGVLHDSGSHTACDYTTNSKAAGYANMCKQTNHKNSAGGSGIGHC